MCSLKLRKEHRRGPADLSLLGIAIGLELLMVIMHHYCHIIKTTLNIALRHTSNGSCLRSACVTRTNCKATAIDPEEIVFFLRYGTNSAVFRDKFNEKDEETSPALAFTSYQ